MIIRIRASIIVFVCVTFISILILSNISLAQIRESIESLLEKVKI